jgi:hypothetical protein
MIITRECVLTGDINTMDIAVTPDQMQSWIDGAFIQDAMPNIIPSEREFIKTGITPNTWKLLDDRIQTVRENL